MPTTRGSSGPTTTCSLPTRVRSARAIWRAMPEWIGCDAFNQCLEDGDHSQEVQEQLAAGSARGVSSTRRSTSTASRLWAPSLSSPISRSSNKNWLAPPTASVPVDQKKSLPIRQALFASDFKGAPPPRPVRGLDPRGTEYPGSRSWRAVLVSTPVPWIMCRPHNQNLMVSIANNAKKRVQSACFLMLTC